MSPKNHKRTFYFRHYAKGTCTYKLRGWLHNLKSHDSIQANKNEIFCQDFQTLCMLLNRFYQEPIKSQKEIMIKIESYLKSFKADI